MNDSEKISEKWFKTMNEHDVAAMSALCSEDAVGEEIAEPLLSLGREQIAKSYRELFAAFPDCNCNIENIFSGQGQVLAEVRWKGTNRGDFRGIPATGKVVDVKIAYIFRISENKITKITEYYDGAAVARQLGLS